MSGWLRITTSFEGISSISASSANIVCEKQAFAETDLLFSSQSGSSAASAATIIPPGFSGAGTINKDPSSIYAWVVLRSTSLFLYEDDQQQKSCFGVASIEDCEISLVPSDLRLDLYYRRENPIMVFSSNGSVFARSPVIFLFAPSAIEKEDWYLLMHDAIQRVSHDQYILFRKKMIILVRLRVMALLAIESCT